MDKAKAAVDGFMHKSGKHDTTVHEHVAPAVTEEHHTREKHENVTTAIDREVHQDHHHTTVQPVHDREVLPEHHEHRVIPVEHREHSHGKDRAIKESLEQERAHFHDTRTEGPTKETHSTSPAVKGEHVHHHVHETIQPVIQKETIQPSVIHTTVPVHEVHHNDPKHHAASALPAVSMADFKKQGGTLTGRGERSDAFAGEPNAISASHASGTGHNIAANPTTGHSSGSHTGVGSSTGYSNTGGAGPHSSSTLNKADPRVDSDADGSRNAGMTQTSAAPTGTHNTHGTLPTRGSGTTGTTAGTAAGTTTGRDPLHHSSNTGPHDSNLANKADPRVDSTTGGSYGVDPKYGRDPKFSANEPTTSTTTSTTGPNTTYGHPTSGAPQPTGATTHHPTSTSTSGTHDPVSSATTEKKKPSLLDRLNPKKDSDGDGKAGFMK